MSWNFRVLKHDIKGEVYFAIHEVYYDDDNTPNSCTTEPINLGLFENVEGLEWTLEKIKEGLKKPILNYSDFEGEKN